ncbi:MAG: DinB family protein [Terriglobales bacterium]
MATSPVALNQFLAEIEAQLRACSVRADQLVMQAGDALWTAPARGGWSVGQCIAHLARTADEWAPRIDEALANAPAGSPPYKPTLTGRLLAWFIEPPYRMKFKAVPVLTPRDRRIERMQLIGEFMEAQRAIERLLRISDGKAIDRVILPSPVDARLKYDLYSTFRIIAAHERRHLWQAERILREIAPR